MPAEYLLQPITSLLPHYRDYGNDELRKKASSDWWTAFERMQVVLRLAADKALDKTKERHKYYMSGMTLVLKRIIKINCSLSLLPSYKTYISICVTQQNNWDCWQGPYKSRASGWGSEDGALPKQNMNYPQANNISDCKKNLN